MSGKTALRLGKITVQSAPPRKHAAFKQRKYGQILPHHIILVIASLIWANACLEEVCLPL
jgi:hypothetical protein